MNKKFKSLSTFSIIGLIVLTGCTTSQATSEVTSSSSSNSAPAQQDTVSVMTSVYPLQLIAEQIGGDYVSVESIYPEDSDPHSYELTPQQSLSIGDSDVVFITDQTEDNAVYKAAEGSNADVVSIEDLVDSQTDNVAKEEAEHHESHMWVTPANGIIIANAITTTLIDVDPSHSEQYNANNDTLITQLEQLDTEYQDFGESQSKDFIVTHDAYEAYTDQYGIKFDALYGEHHDDEPTTKDIVDIVDLIKEQDIKTIFVEQNDTDNEVMKQISDESGAEIEVFYNLETASSLKSFDSITDFYEYNLEMLKLGQE